MSRTATRATSAEICSRRTLRPPPTSSPSESCSSRCESSLPHSAVTFCRHTPFFLPVTGCFSFQVKSGVELPGSGDYWNSLRDGSVAPPEGCGAALAGLISGMMAALPAQRPSADNILQACCAEAERAVLASLNLPTM